VLFTYGAGSRRISLPKRSSSRSGISHARSSSRHIVVAVYLLTNLAYLRVLGHAGWRPVRRRLPTPCERSSDPPAQDHRGRDRAFDIRLSEPRDSGDATRTAGHGRGRRVLPSLRRPASAYQTPTAAIVALAAFAVLLTLTGTFGQLVTIDVRDWIFFGLTAACVFVTDLGAGSREQGALSRTRLSVTVIIFVLVAAYVVFSSIVSNPATRRLAPGLLDSESRVPLLAEPP